MDDRPPRPSTDQEEAPLLRDPDAPDTEPERPSLLERINGVATEPLTPLSKFLLVLTLLFLLLSSIFIGLFAGVKYKYDHSRGDNDGDHGTPEPTETVTLTATSTFATTTTVDAPIPTPTGKPEEPACLTPQCIILSASILSSLDTSQDPCENFYEYANGGWLSSHPLPADKGSYGQFEALAEASKQVVQRILESADTKGSPDDVFDAQILLKMRNMYQSCLNEDGLNNLGTEPLLHFVKTLKDLYRGDTTVIRDEQSAELKKPKKLTEALAFLHSRGISALFNFGIEGDVGIDPNNMTLWFEQPELGLPSKEYYLDESTTKVYEDTMAKLLLIVISNEEDEEYIQGSPVNNEEPVAPVIVQQDGENSWPPWPWPPWGDGDDDGRHSPINKTKKAQKLAKAVLEFESDIAKASLDLDVLQSDPFATYNPAPFKNLTDGLEQIHFGSYLSTFTPRAFPSRVIIQYPPYVKSLARILDTANEDVIEAYLVTRAALALAPYLGPSTDAWLAQHGLYEALSGVKKGVVGDRGEYCLGQVEDTLGYAAGRFFVKETFGGDSKEKGTKVITDIIGAFKNSLDDVKWMDEKSGKAAKAKADAIRVKVGYPVSPDTMSAQSIARYYSRVNINETDFMGNKLNSFASDEFKAWMRLGGRRDQEAWEMYPTTVNAYFNPPANEIVFPAAILKPPFFSKDWPAYLSYGAFGHVAAHELTHAFDSAGRLYNPEGKLEEWWTKNTSDGFNVHQECIVNQFSAYTIDDGKGGVIHVNGNLTSGEAIGDTGLIQAYRAWKAQYSDSLQAGDEYILPGLDFTREQLFFISFARIWARSMKTASAIQRVRTDPHPPNPFRVDGTLSNIPEFAEAFKCSKKAKLNPPRDKQCIFW